MRRVLTYLAALVLVVGSLGVGVFTADLPFWQRAFQLPLAPDDAYLPIATLGADAVPAPLATVPAAESAFDAATLDNVAAQARDAGSRALLVMRRGRIEVERYFGADDENTLMPAALIAKPLAAMAIGRALADGRIASLDAPLGLALNEWNDEPRGRITPRQLLEETSGLETGGDIAGLYQRSPWTNLSKLPAFATSRGVRLMLGNDFQRTALGFPLKHEPGGFYNVSPANVQVAAVLIERRTGTAYEKYLDEKLWRPLGAGRAELQLDRRAGMPAAHCCWRATARDVLRVANLLASDGVVGGRAVLPPGWVREMAKPSRVNAETGLELTRVSRSGVPLLTAEDDQGSSFWVLPDQGLTIVNIAGPGGEAMSRTMSHLPDAMIAALKSDSTTP
ncbi:MAG TPA: serine hydrolase domain-containing protein [Steroidobacteraceae bacterium]|nr:serine hydrolase domain-containing protein [Steroidobacteraceae bacterium]